MPNRWLPKSHTLYDHLFREAADVFFEATPLTWLHAKALGVAESSLRARAVSPAGARGVMQLMPATGAELGLRSEGDFFDPRTNILTGTRYLRRMWEFFRTPPSHPRGGERYLFAVAAYNAGAGNILKAQARAGALGYPKADFVGVAAALPLITFSRAKETLHHVARVKMILHALAEEEASTLREAA